MRVKVTLRNKVMVVMVMSRTTHWLWLLVHFTHYHTRITTSLPEKAKDKVRACVAGSMQLLQQFRSEEINYSFNEASSLKQLIPIIKIVKKSPRLPSLKAPSLNTFVLISLKSLDLYSVQINFELKTYYP